MRPLPCQFSDARGIRVGIVRELTGTRPSDLSVFLFRLSAKRNRAFSFIIFSPRGDRSRILQAEPRRRYRHQFPDPCHVSFTNVSCDARQRRLLPVSYTETRFNPGTFVSSCPVACWNINQQANSYFSHSKSSTHT